MKDYLKLMRIKHYLKNFLIFLPLLFSGKLLQLGDITNELLAFVSFSLAASVVYIINDIKDKEKDKLHATKKNRPIASDKISVKNAIIFAMMLMIISLFFQYLAGKTIFSFSYLLVIIYVGLNIAYSFGLKNVALLDIVILSSGFLIRVLYGASIIGVKVSNWLYLTILAAALYLVLGKRRNEITKLGNSARPVLKYYTEDFLDKNMYMCLGLTIVFYSMWATDITNVIKTNNMLIWTVPLIIIILMKYSMNVENDSLGDPVDVVIKDKVLLTMIAVYGLILIGIIYLWV